ncbi:MAG: zinc ribbon domain-containing protein [Pseudomonadota bacterium]
MPIYEYECQQCGHTLDALEKISDSPQRKCPECGRLKLKRLVSAPKFRLKGEGWYETDFKSDNKRNLADSGNDSAPKDNSKSDGGEKKPATADGAKKEKKAVKSSDGGKAA